VATAERLTRRMQRQAAEGVTIDLLWNPEFLREGFAIEDTLTPDRIVYGVAEPGSEAAAAAVSRLDEVYAAPLATGIPRIVTDHATAELGADQALTFLREVDEINHRRRAKMVELARAACGGTLRGKTVAILGAAFKPNSDDIRDSPALDVAEACQRAGATVRVHDPQALPVARTHRPGLDYVDVVRETVRGADVVLHLTEWQLYRDLDPADLLDASGEGPHVVIDGRNTLDPQRWREAGWTYQALGRPNI
jgi:UDP-glucose 6-dehydrogenase